MGHDVLPAVRGENGLVGPRRSVERDLFLYQTLGRRQLRVGVADHDKRRCRVGEISAFASGLAHALFCPWKNTLAEIFRAGLRPSRKKCGRPGQLSLRVNIKRVRVNIKTLYTTPQQPENPANGHRILTTSRLFRLSLVGVRLLVLVSKRRIISS